MFITLDETKHPRQCRIKVETNFIQERIDSASLLPLYNVALIIIISYHLKSLFYSRICYIFLKTQCWTPNVSLQARPWRISNRGASSAQEGEVEREREEQGEQSGNWFAVRLRELTTGGSGESCFSAEQNLRAWAENRRTVNSCASRKSASPAPPARLEARHHARSGEEQLACGHKELLHLRGLVRERRGSTALSHAISKSGFWTLDGGRRASAGSRCQITEMRLFDCISLPCEC